MRHLARPSRWTLNYSHIAFCILLICIIVAWIEQLPSSTLEDNDAFDYAQMGRQIRLGKGFSTLHLFPRQIPYLYSHGYLKTEPAPNLYRFPLTPLANAATQLLVPDPERAAVVQSGVWFLLSVLLVYLLALEFGTPSIALLCAAAYALQTSSWSTAFNGLTESLATLLTLTVIYLTFSTQPSRVRAVALGAACGLAYLCRSQLAFLLPWSLLFFWLSTKGLRRGILVPLVLVGACVVLAPWLLRNFIITGSPFFSFFTTSSLVLYTGWPNSLSDIELQLHAPVALTDVLGQYGGAILLKVFHNIWPNILNPIALTTNRESAALLTMSVLGLIFILFHDRNHELIRFRRFLVGTLLLVIVNFCISSLVSRDPRFYVELNPVIIIAGVQSMVLMISVLGKRNGQRVGTGLYMLAISICAIFLIIRIGTHQFISSLDKESYRFFATSVAGKGTVASDDSSKIALYAGMQSIRLPSNPSELFEISERYIPIDYVILSARLIRQSESTANQVREFGRYVPFRTSSEFLTRYTFVGVLPNGAELYYTQR